MPQSNRYAEWHLGGNIQGVWGALVCGGLMGFAYFMHLDAVPHSLWVMPLGAAAGFAAGKTIGALLLGAAGRSAESIYMPRASGTYANTHSNIDTLEARGDYRGAVAAWEVVAVAEPANPWPLIRAGELYARVLNEPELAVERFRVARDTRGITPEHHRYATQKLVDLYLGPLNDEGRALVELRRLVELHTDSREAEGARVAIKRLKTERQQP